MGSPLSYSVREKIISLRQSGRSFKEISQTLNCSESGSKKIWYNYLKHGASALKANYTNCGRRSPYGTSIRDEIAKVRDNQQGSTYVYSKLAQSYDKDSIPHARTICRWWKKAGTNRKRGRPTSIEKKYGQDKPTVLGK